MASVVLWCYKNDRGMWTAYQPAVSRELERLYSLGSSSQTVNMGTLCSSLASYQLNFTHMTQVTIRSGSTREVRRKFCDPATAAGQGVVWEFEGDIPSHWVAYDLDTMDVIEEAFAKRNQLNTSVVDLQQSRVHLPYIIDFAAMTQIRVETGRMRQIQRRPLTQTYSPTTSLSLGTSFLQGSSSVFSGQASWQPSQQMPIISASKSKHRHQPYTVSKPAGVPAVNGLFNGSGPPTNVPSLGLLPQQPSQNAGPVTRRKLQQTTGSSTSISSTSVLHQQPYSAAQQMYHSAPQQYFQQALHNLHISGPYQHLLGLPVPTAMSGFQYPSSSLTQSLSMTSMSSLGQSMSMASIGQPLPISSIGQSLSMSSIPPSLTHPQMSRSSSTSSTSSSMSVSSSQGSEPLPSVSKVTISKSKKTKGKTGLNALKNYMNSIHTNLDTTDCSICCSKLSEASSYGEGQAEAHEAVELNKCRHQFHKLCLVEMYNSIHKDSSLQCPSCKTIYGEKTGTCPPGYMQWKVVHNLPLAGYEGHGTIIVTYHISAGIQGPEHPNPGQGFSARGFPRQGFLPDCDKGRKVLKLLMEAFRRRLMFTIATSNTTGEINTVTWNEIHHKTEPQGNRTGHGYPDPNYLDNVLLELAAHGVTDDCLR